MESAVPIPISRSKIAKIAITISLIPVLSSGSFLPSSFSPSVFTSVSSFSSSFGSSTSAPSSGLVSAQFASRE